MKHEIPIIIPTFNNPTYLQHMLDQLQSFRLADVIVVDNASTTSEMTILLDALEKKIKVVRLAKNYGPQYYCQNKNFYRGLPKYFCVTDPDLLFNERMPRTFLDDLIKLTEQFKTGKVGFALDISDSSKMRTDPIRFNNKEYHIWEWEAQFWLEKIGDTPQHDPIYKAPVDTTFALYNKEFFDPDRSNEAIRVSGRYTCKHLPWYTENKLPKSEELAYRATQLNSWYFGGLKALPENLTLNERLTRNRLLIGQYGLHLWLSEKLTRWLGMSKSWKKIQTRMNLIDGK